jgi:hypothetical protein
VLDQSPQTSGEYGREKMKTGKERRIHPRIDKQLPMRVAVNGYDFVTNTQNVSCLGTYCSINKYIPPFTRVKIKLDLPIKNVIQPVECEGVIVRAEDDADGKFDIAIFFNKIKDQPKQRLTEYVSQFLG